ncbi:hypothetical protein [uncultured Thiodictyon sp.]|uniref:hypothetical protein n=1 Tax=uncultured Thiodictyon sp. TaxID=1846217 RepID=UPI0025D97A8C|nr:hypothetical protein [uncultured Thiodictyon sp.]
MTNTDNFMMLFAVQFFALASLLFFFARRISTMSEALTALIAQVAAIENVADSAIVLLNGIHAQLMDALAANDPIALTALADRLLAQTNELAEAVAANTAAE